MSGLNADQRRLVEQSTGLVWKAVHELSSQPLNDPEDDFQDGCIGLMRATEVWDPAKGAFSTIAYKCIGDGIRAGRSRRHGVNYRRLQGKGGWWIPDSLDVPLSEDDTRTVGDLLPEVVQEADEMHPGVKAAMAHLTERELVMIQHDCTEAGAILGIKPKSVLRQRVRIYARIRAELAVAS